MTERSVGLWNKPIVRIINIIVGALLIIISIIEFFVGIIFIAGIITIVFTVLLWIGCVIFAMIGLTLLAAGIRGISPVKAWGDIEHSFEVAKAQKKAKEIAMVENEFKKLR